MFNILRRRIEVRNYSTLHKWFIDGFAWAKDIRDQVGFYYSQYVFLAGHFIFFSISHVCSLIAYYSEKGHLFLMFLWLLYSVWAGSGHYVKYFTYTHRLEKAEELKAQQKMVEKE